MPIGIHTVDFDLRIATERLDSRESEFPPTPECVKIILKSTIISGFLQKLYTLNTPNVLDISRCF